MDGVRLERSEAPRCHPKDPLRPSKHEYRVPAKYAGMVGGISPRGVLLEFQPLKSRPAILSPMFWHGAASFSAISCLTPCQTATTIALFRLRCGPVAI